MLPTIQSRKRLLDLLAPHIQQAQQHKRDLGLILVDLKRFADINAQHGYQVGDQLLGNVFAQLMEIVKNEQCLLRTGSNEFALILPLLPNSFVCHLAAQKVLDSLNLPVEIKHHQVVLHPVLGVALFDQNRPDPQSLCLDAEAALQQARLQAKEYCLYYPKDSEHQALLGMEEKIDQALADDAFELYFQPKLDLASRQPYGAESLIRWKQKNDQYISPELFIPFAEHTGQIIPISKWIIQNAMRKQCELQKCWPNLNLAINLSGLSFKSSSLADDIAHAIKIWGANPSCITLEITESAFMEDLQVTREICNELREKIGVKISIDDFGTGFSSLEYFKSIPADELKIDQSFVKNILTDPKDRHIVDMVIQLAQGVGLKVVAEGVEDLDTLRMLTEMHCDIAQGYGIARPIDNEHFSAWLDHHRDAQMI